MAAGQYGFKAPPSLQLQGAGLDGMVRKEKRKNEEEEGAWPTAGRTEGLEEGDRQSVECFTAQTACWQA